jgi:flagella basal body P-ring formation protein FlgA
VREALSRALAVPGGRVEALDWRPALPSGCAATEAEAARPLAASGRVAVRLRGTAAGGPCQGSGWAQVRVLAPALVAARALREGEPLATAPAEVELRAGRAPLAALPEGALAARAIPAGAPIDVGMLRVGPRPGEPVVVVLRAGALTVEQSGRALPCARGRGCALLPSGRRVEGRLDGGRILVEMP